MRALLIVMIAALATYATAAAQVTEHASSDVPDVESTGRPAPGPYPNPPSVDRPENEPLPERVALERDAAAVGRMNGAELTARFDFDAKAGELSLFELTAWGYARGWVSDSVMIVRDAKGVELERRVRIGGTVYQDVLPFVAPEDGAYSLELGTVENGFRYRMIRHAGYVPHTADTTFSIGERDVAYEWIDGVDDSITFRVAGEPGERIVLRAEPTNERGLGHKRSMRRRIAPAIAGFVELARMKERLGPRGRDDDSFPDLRLAVDEAVLVEGAGHCAIARVPASGSLEVTVHRTNPGPPGLFDLAVERDVEFTSFDVRVGDGEDEPVADAEVALFREPAFDLVGLVTTDAEGLARADVPVGDYTLVYRGPDGRPQTLRTRVAGEPLNLVLGGR